MRIPKQYYKNHKDEFDLSESRLLINGEGIDIVTTFGRDEMGVYMKDGIKIAKAFGFVNPTKARLDFQTVENFFKLTPIGDLQIPYVFTVHVKEEPIEIVSDDEIEVEDVIDSDEEEVAQQNVAEKGFAGNQQEAGVVEFFHFEKNVTAALASVERPQVLHFPDHISKRVLRRRYLKMELEDVETHKTYSCKIQTVGRRNAEKSLCGEWFDFVMDRGLKENNKLIFDLEDPPTKMWVEHVRKGLSV